MCLNQTFEHSGLRRDNVSQAFSLEAKRKGLTVDKLTFQSGWELGTLMIRHATSGYKAFGHGLRMVAANKLDGGCKSVNRTGTVQVAR